jgi:CubicO group peptidase (beta-lactamase class C family)
VGWIALVLLLGVRLWPNSGLLAQSQPTTRLDAAEVEPLMDGAIAAQLAAFRLPGATLSIVQDGQLLFAKGYGYADIAKQTPVVADKTLFRPGSISKLFVWTAVMQLVEQGKLDLDADVNRYLTAFQIPPTFPQPITLAHLMSHTPGFEEQGLGTFAASEEELQPLETYLASHIPARVRPPGQLTAYSNYGAALAGYIVGEVSGLGFEQYMAQEILQPLQMKRSTFQQPLPDTLASDMATGYLYTGAGHEPQAFEWVQASPAGALSSTATDLANFMIVHLQDGRFGDTRILQEATAQTMHSQLFTNDPRVNGFAHGFEEGQINGQHLLFHGGDTLWFHSTLVLLPEQHVGFFVSYNGANGSVAVDNTIRTFMDHYYPAPPPPPAAPAADLARYVGSYRAARSNESTPEKAIALFQNISVAATADQALLVSFGTPAQLVWRFVQVEPLLFRSADLPPSVLGGLAFQADASGRITAMFQENNPTTAFLRLPWYESAGVQLGLLAICLLFFLSVIAWGPIGFWMRRHFQRSLPWAARLASWTAGLLSLVCWLFVIAFIVMFSNPKIAFGLPPWSRYLMLVPWAIVVLAVAMLVFSLLAWAGRYWSVAGRIHYTLTTLAALAFVWWLYHWNLLLIRG